MGKPIPSPVDLPDPGIEAGSPALQADSLLRFSDFNSGVKPKCIGDFGESVRNLT